MKIVIIGGGTGGHIFPLVAIIKKIKERFDLEHELLYIGPKSAMERKIMSSEGVRTRFILVGKMRRYFSWWNFIDALKVPIGFIQSMWILLMEMPDAVFSKGGFASIPVVLAARIYRIPVLVHESDATPGLANRILGQISNRVAISYPKTEKNFISSKVLLTGIPLRDDINKGNKQSVMKKFGLSEVKPVIFVLGGSQGSWAINKAVVDILPRLLKIAQVIHQTGERTHNDTLHLAGEEGVKSGRDGYHAIASIENEEMKNMLACADLVISRAGATSIAEIAANKKPSILVPLESSANDHQRMNAYEVAEIGGALVLEEPNLGENMFYDKINEILSDQELRDRMAGNIETFYHPEASDRIVEGIIEMIPKKN